MNEPDPAWDYAETYKSLKVVSELLNSLVIKVAQQEEANTETDNDIKTTTYRMTQLLLEIQEPYEQEEKLRATGEPTQETGVED